MQPLRILIVDDHQAVRRGLRSLLGTRTEWEICGEAADGLDAIEKAKELRPDLVLMDISMPRMSGIEATRIIRSALPETKVIIVSQNDPAVVRKQAREISANGYLAKTDLVRDLVPAIEIIAASRNSNGKSPELLRDLVVRTAQVEAKENAERLRAVFDSSAIGFAALSLDGQILEANDAFCALTRYSRAELESLEDITLTHPDDRARRRTQMKRLAAQEIPSFVIDERCIRKDGSTIWVQHSVSVSRGAGSQPLNIVALCQEFTERGRLVTQLRDTEQRFRDMIDALPTAVYTTDAEGRITHFNPAAVEFSGQVPEIGSARWCVSWKLFWPDGRPMPLDECPMAVALRDGHVIDGVEAIAERPDGTRIWFTPYPRVLRDVDGKIVGGINMLVDITARKQAERTSSLLASIVDSSDDAVVSKRLDGVITSWNGGAERLFGWTSQEAVGRHITLIIPTDRIQEETEIINRIRRGERVDHFETVRVRKDGTPVDISVTISPVKDASGQVIGASKVARDITERKRADETIRANEERLRELSASLDAEVRARTKELEERNAELLWSSEQLRDLSRRMIQVQDEERRHIARELHDSAGQTLTVLSINLAALAKKVRAELVNETKDLQEVVHQLSQEIRTTSYLLHPPLLDEIGLPAALQWYAQGLEERSDLKIEVNVPEDFGRLATDLELVIFRLVQECLNNIHRHSGGKTAKIQLTRGAENVSLEVEDHGKGIPAEKLVKVQSQGSGVGIRGMGERVRQFGGEMKIESADRGTKILFTLPCTTNRPRAEENSNQPLHAAD